MEIALVIFLWLSGATIVTLLHWKWMVGNPDEFYDVIDKAHLPRAPLESYLWGIAMMNLQSWPVQLWKWFYRKIRE